MNSSESGTSLNLARFIRSRVSRFGRFGLSKKYKEVLMTPLSDEQRNSVMEKLRKKGLQHKPECRKLKEDNQGQKRQEDCDTKKVTFETKDREGPHNDPADRFIEELLSSAPSSPTMSERQIRIRPGALNIRIDDAGHISDVSQSVPSSPSIETGYYDTIPLLPECRNDSKEFFHPTNVPFKSFFPFQAIDRDYPLPDHLDENIRFVVGSEQPERSVKGSFHLRSGKVQSLSQLLEKLQIRHLSSTFKSFGIEDLRAFTKINEHVLEKMMISSMEVRTKILTAIELLSETEDSPEDCRTDALESVEPTTKRLDHTGIVCQREVSEVGYISNTFVQKDATQHISRSHRYSKEIKNPGSRKATSVTPSRGSSSQRKYQYSKRVPVWTSRTRSHNLTAVDLQYCKEPTIIHQHIHHHHHIEWNYRDHVDRESTRSAVEARLHVEMIDLTDFPYSDQSGSSGVPLRLVERYTYDLDKDIREVAVAMEMIRCDQLLERNRLVRSNMDAILSDQFLNCDGIKTDNLESFLVSIGLPMYVAKIKQKRCRNLQTLLLYSDEALCRNFCIKPSHVRWIRREASFFPTGFLSHISHHKQGSEAPSQRFRSSSDAKFFALDKV